MANPDTKARIVLEIQLAMAVIPGGEADEGEGFVPIGGTCLSAHRDITEEVPPGVDHQILAEALPLTIDSIRSLLEAARFHGFSTRAEPWPGGLLDRGGSASDVYVENIHVKGGEITGRHVVRGKAHHA